ncbi:DUF5686 and carboxypeptidase regulatory-like domain-containing protein [Dyadobacter sp. CY326]|uniref:DUF5686 and carboxypeptidase regulatory-like domain-containing protein n=1 Tax=Dyadobacter sp. CY326 TaxID=2907300 RepID=UPI001F2EC11E|nr:DUF5686 and carboxypeptidase regulatory-like domain-containing protein [Dyadobacter sp. CY326]MCE7066349.1 DUF5686 and carboxypeptidase regulatory-like domain-containing protein [Dyadobacter sp. CY326]
MLKLYVSVILLFLLVVGQSVAQSTSSSGIKGIIKTKNGDPLPFAAIIVKGTAISTISNEEGRYQLDLKPGYYEVIFQYLGFKTGQKGFTVESKMETFDLTMEEQALTLGEVRIGSRDEDPAYTIMRRAIAKSRYHLLQVDSYVAKAYSKSSVVITDLPLEFLYKKELKEVEKETNFKKGVPILNESVSEVTFKQPNSYKQKVIAARSSQDKDFANPNAYLLTSFYQPEVVKAVSPLSPRAFAYYKFEYLGAFRENGIEVNKIKVTPRSYGEGVYKGTIHIIEDEWSIYSLDLTTVNTGFTIDIKQVYSPVQGVWMPVNQQFHVQGGIYGLKGKGDFVISQSFSNIKINPAFRPDIVVVDDKKQKEEAKKVKLSDREIKSQKLEEVVSKQREFSAKNLRKMMKEYEKQDLKAKEEKGEDIDLNFSRNDSTVVDSMAAMRSMAFWDSIRTVPLTTAEIKSYTRLDSIVVVTKGTQEQKDSLKVAKSDTTKRNNKGGGLGFVGDIFTGRSFRLGKKSPWRLDYVTPLLGAQVNTVEGLVLNGGGLKLHYNGGSARRKPDSLQVGSDKAKRFPVRQNQELTFNALTRYSFARQKLMPYGEIDYGWQRHKLSLSGGQNISQFNGENPMHPLLNSITTLFLEQNFIKIYEKNFVRLDFSTNRENEHFELKANIEYADRSPLRNVRNTSPYRWIDWKRREFTSNIPFNEELTDESRTASVEMQQHQALTLGLAAAYKPWQKYRTRKGKTSYYDDDSPKLSVNYRKGINDVFGSDVKYDFFQIGIQHGFETGVRSKLSYKLAAGQFRGDSVAFPDYQHFAGNRFFFQMGDPVSTFRMLDYYRYSTSKHFFEAHVLSEFRKFLLTQITWFRVLGIKENFMLHYLATPTSNNYAELGYGLDVGIRFPFRVEVVNSFEGFKYKNTVFRIGTTMNFNLGRN